MIWGEKKHRQKAESRAEVLEIASQDCNVTATILKNNTG